MNLEKIVEGQVDGKIEGSTRGPRGPKKQGLWNLRVSMSRARK